MFTHGSTKSEKCIASFPFMLTKQRAFGMFLNVFVYVFETSNIFVTVLQCDYVSLGCGPNLPNYTSDTVKPNTLATVMTYSSVCKIT